MLLSTLGASFHHLPDAICINFYKQSYAGMLAGSEAVSSSRLGASRHGIRPRLPGILKATDYVPSTAAPNELLASEGSSSDDLDEPTFRGSSPLLMRISDAEMI